MLKHVITGTGLAIGATLLSVGQAFAGDFIIDSFDVQFTPPFTNSQVQSGREKITLRTGTDFPTSASSPARITDPSGLPFDQVIGGSRDLNMYGIQNTNALPTSGTSRIHNREVDFWQVRGWGGSRVSSSMIWDNIDPLAPASASNSGRFKERLNTGALAFKTLDVISGSTDPLFQSIFTLTVRDSSGNSASVSRTDVGSNQFVFIRFTEFEAAAASLNLNAINYVELNVKTGGGNISTVQVDFVQGFEIPEPSLALGSVIVFGLGFLSTKRRAT
jgi:hypothetical protein